MAKKNHAKSGKIHDLDSLLFNITIAFICILGIGGSLLIFRWDMNRTNEQLDEKPPGTVYWVNNSAKRLSSRNQALERLERGSPVYDGDIISSAAFSEVRIRFRNGETLELLENTSVFIKYSGGELPGFELLRGEIEIQSDRLGLVVSLANASVANAAAANNLRVNLEPYTNANIRASDDITLKFFQGSAAVNSGAESRAAEAGNIFKTGRDGVFMANPPVVMLSPRNNARILRRAPGKKPVKFQWQKAKSHANASVLLEISETSDFAGLIGSWYSDGSDSMEIDLSEGIYHWKAFLLSSGEELDSGRFDIVSVTGPRAILPSDGSVQSYYDGKQELRFAWSVPEETEAVLLEVASNAEMSRPRLRQLIKRTESGYGSFVSSGLEAGKWYWRVHPVYLGELLEGESGSSSMGSAQGFWRVHSVNASVMADNDPSPVNSFTLAEAATSAGDNRPELPEFIAEPGNLPRLLFPGDNHSLESSRTPDLFFSWKNPVSYTARLQISGRSDFSSSLIMDEEVQGAGMQSPFLKPGTYYWRITGQSGSSSPTRLVIEPALIAPNLNSPANNERLRIEEGNSSVRFTWERMYYANYYEYNIFQEGRDVPLGGISSLQNNMVVVYFDPSTQGRFYWTVQGFSAPSETSSGRRGLIAESRFSISPPAGQTGQAAWANPRITNMQTIEGTVKSPITLLSPAAGANVPGIQALRSPLAARWTTEESLTNVQLIVSRSTDPLTDPKAIVKDAGSSSVSFPSLSEGRWYWIIRGDTHDARGATPGDPFWLNVLPIPLLIAPPPIRPEEQSVIDLGQLTRDRSIVFSWDKVAGANAYIFSLFRTGAAEADPPALLVTSAPEAVFSYVLNDLTILNNGNYLWQVEAIYLNNMGIIEQRGRIEPHRFSIDIQHSTDLQTQRQGTMYGQ